MTRSLLLGVWPRGPSCAASSAPLTSHRWFARWLAPLLTVAVLLGVNAASAQTGTILVAPFQGSKPQGLRELAVQLLEADGFTVVDGSGLSGDAGEWSVKSAASDKKAAAVLFVQTGLTKVYWRSTLTVRDGSTGKVVGEATIQAKSYKGLQKAYKQDLIDELMPLFEKCSEDDEPAPREVKATAGDSDDGSASAAEEEDWGTESAAEESPEASSTAEDLGPDERQQRRDSLKKIEALVLTLGPALAIRNWTINDPFSSSNDGALLPAHDVPGVGMRIGFLVFPAAFFSDSVARHIGLQVNYSRSFTGETNVANVTRDPNDTVRATTIQAYDAGLHIRMPLDPLTLGIVGTYGVDSTVIDGDKSSVAVPDVAAEYLKGGLIAQLAVGKTTAVRLGLGYRYVLGFGSEVDQLQSDAWFPKSRGMGFDGRLDVRQMFSSVFGLMLGGEINQYAIDFDVQPDHVSNAANAGRSAPPIAGGATDRYLRFDLSAVIALDQ